MNTQAAIDELNDVLRVLFPIVPHKNHIILAARNQRLWMEHPKVLKSSAHFLADSLQQKGQRDQYFRGGPAGAEGGALGAEDETESEEPRGRFGFYGRQQQQHHTLSDLFRPANDYDRSAMLGPPSRETSVQQLPTPIDSSRSRVLEQEISPEASIVGSSFFAKAADVSREGVFPIVQQQQEQQQSASENRPERLRPPPPALPHFIMRGSKVPLAGKSSKGSNGASQTVRLPTKPELTTPSLGKRGPECMRRCIMQGLLHPVQCHSLC